MPDCLVDRIAIPIDSTRKTWGEILEFLDRRLSSQGRAVAVVRFEGVDQPSFHEASQLQRAMPRVR
jgi:hypothetical protein